ncbi:hypothetical protein Ahy_A07g035483 isoform B [Arachis hypogaea]|uniref:Uncharacterized protein n=1 Tax=Arachis hypogaea TaxID=3818 RepID=A0A445CE29_ARAHY|nr:hypothetical protein Ahy_A07g035483 isoform B [Arachis hypogaea]
MYSHVESRHDISIKALTAVNSRPTNLVRSHSSFRRAAFRGSIAKAEDVSAGDKRDCHGTRTDNRVYDTFTRGGFGLSAITLFNCTSYARTGCGGASQTVEPSVLNDMNYNRRITRF